MPTTPASVVTGVDFVSVSSKDFDAAIEFSSTTSRPPERSSSRAGITFAGETLDTSVCHMAPFKDPDGNRLMLHHRYAPRTPKG